MNSDGIWSLVDADSMRALDRYTIEELGIPGEILMESAGRAIAEVVLEVWRERDFAARGREVVAVCGTGNNGGDGLVVARHLHQLGMPVRAVLPLGCERMTPDAGANLARARALGVELEVGTWHPPSRGVIVDALFGTGLSRPIEGHAREVIEAINAAARRGVEVIAADLPSGVHADTGAELGLAVRARHTVTMQHPKLGLSQEPARSAAGRIRVAKIGIADEAPGIERRASMWSWRAAAASLPTRGPAGHKGSFGHVLVIAGSEGKTGACVLSSLGAQRAGAGLVTIACPAGLSNVIEEKTTEAMSVAVAETHDHSFAADAKAQLLGLAAERDVVAIGPGIGENPETRGLIRSLVSEIERPLVIDADGLNAFAEESGSIGMLKGRQSGTLLTPHPGEAARLLGQTPAEVNRNRPDAARELAGISGATVLLKGAGSVIATANGAVTVNPTGGPNLASGGTGDVLTGICAAYLAQGLEEWRAAALASYTHGAAADLLSRSTGAGGMLASELADAIPLIMEGLRRRATDAGDAGIATDECGLLLRFPGT